MPVKTDLKWGIIIIILIYFSITGLQWGFGQKTVYDTKEITSPQLRMINSGEGPTIITKNGYETTYTNTTAKYINVTRYVDTVTKTPYTLKEILTMQYAWMVGVELMLFHDFPNWVLSHKVI
jgi:hypothetical protein